ncbi:hypothetical protein IC235_11870 [Hymenobacter sp. BT664]|uniref:Uncharacterized protein n=1 Tax=Hymenobacter montanus TaxID=2771359 RepID=A0A927BEG7_9BACT|nr:hypothetical protein [Hymenobacter montanus]MBD2768584.1 hypothetical protein [Hymenobacter montanus]
MKLFKVLPALTAFLLPGMAMAQFNLALGTYELANGSKGEAELKLVLAQEGKPTVVMGVKNGNKRTFRTSEINAFTIDNHSFITIKDFRFRSGSDADFKDPVLLEILETGPVELYYYYYLVEMGPNFKAHAKLPVLRKTGTNVFFAYSPTRTPGFDQKLAPGTFVAALFPADPVLQRKFAINGIPHAQLRAAVHAYNEGVRLPR